MLLLPVPTTPNQYAVTFMFVPIAELVLPPAKLQVHMKGDSDSAELLLITRLYARFVEGSCDGPGAEVVAWDGKEVGTTVRPGNGTVDGCGVGYIELILKLLAPLSPHAKTVHRSTATSLAIAITMVLAGSPL